MVTDSFHPRPGERLSPTNHPKTQGGVATHIFFWGVEFDHLDPQIFLGDDWLTHCWLIMFHLGVPDSMGGSPPRPQGAYLEGTAQTRHDDGHVYA